MKDILLVLQIIVSLLLVVAILIQTKGTGFGRVWGSGGTSFARRGLERLVFRSTFILSAVFVILAILQVIF